MNPFGHIDLRVRDLVVAQEFYEALLPPLGFTERYHGDLWKAWADKEELPATAYFASRRVATTSRTRIGSRSRSPRRMTWIGSPRWREGPAPS